MTSGRRLGVQNEFMLDYDGDPVSAVGGKNVPTTYAIVLKDLRSELRTRYALNALVMGALEEE